MRAIQQLLSSIRRILGISSSIRSTTRSVKREADYVSKGKKTNNNHNQTN